MGDATCRSEHFFTEYKRCDLAPAEVKADIVKDGANFLVEVSTDKPAFFVTLETTVPGVFEDNAFLLVPGESRRVSFTPKAKTTLAELRKSLQVKHLRQTYR